MVEKMKYNDKYAHIIFKYTTLENGPMLENNRGNVISDGLISFSLFTIFR